MTLRATRRAVLLGLGASGLAACARLEAPGPVETAERPSEGGIGGTGIVGTLVDSRDFTVNGLSLTADEALTLRDAYGALTRDRLALGQVLTVEATSEENGELRAQALSVVHPLIGQIEAIERGKITILGTEVTVERGAPRKDADGRNFRPKVGQRVAVSGLWRGPDVVASRLDLLPAELDAPSVIAGVVKAGPAPDRPTLGGLELVLSAGQAAPPLGTFVTAQGNRVGRSFEVSSLREGRFQGAAGPLERLSVEGYLDRVPRAPGFVVADLGHSFDPDAKLQSFAQERALFVGPYIGTFEVALGLPLPENFSQRRRLVERIEDGFDPKGAVSTR